jgi:hypothetical protein
MEITKEILNQKFEYVDGNLFNRKNGKKYGTLRPNGYMQFCIKRKTYLMHRIIFMMHYGYLPKCLDHIDGNPLNNRIENLREATQSENNCNQKLRVTNKSGLKNIHWASDKRKWIAKITINKKTKFLGAYKDLELAELVAEEARHKYHKEFANHG